VKDGQQILNANIKLKDGYPTRTVKVQLNWVDGRPPGEVTVTAHAAKGENPAARQIGEGLYEFTLLQSTSYTFSAWEDLDPHRQNQRHGQTSCAIPARIESDIQKIPAANTDVGDAAGGDAAANATDSAASDATDAPSTFTLTFTNPPCN